MARMDDKTFAVVAGRVLQAVPPDLQPAVRAALLNNGYLHGRAGVGNAKRRSARQHLERRANAGDTRAAASLAIAGKLCAAQQGDTAAAVRLYKAVVDRSRGLAVPVTPGDFPELGAFGDRIKKAAKKVANTAVKVVTSKPFKGGYNAAAKTVTTVLPFTKPLVKAQKQFGKELVGVVKKVAANPKKATAIANRLAPGIGKSLGQGRKNLIVQAALGKLAKGTYQVRCPDGSVVNIPATKVVGS